MMGCAEAVAVDGFTGMRWWMERKPFYRVFSVVSLVAAFCMVAVLKPSHDFRKAWSFLRSGKTLLFAPKSSLDT